MLFDLFGPLLGPLLIVIMVIVVFESCWRKCPPDKLMIVSGFGQTRSVSGKGTFVIPGLRRRKLPDWTDSRIDRDSIEELSQYG